MHLVTSVYTMLDTSMLGFFSTDAQVGFYTAATKLNRMTVELLTALTAVLLPRLSFYKENNEDQKFFNLSEKSISIVILLAIPMVIGLIFLAKPLVILFSGEEYIEAVPAMNIISPIILAIGLTSITGTQILPALRKEKITLLSYGGAALSNITLNFIFIPKFGAKGAALGTLVAEFSVLIIQAIYLHNYITKTILKSALQSIICCIPMIGIILLLSRFIQNPIILCITVIILSVIIYALGLTLCKNQYFKEMTGIFINKLKRKPE